MDPTVDDRDRGLPARLVALIRRDVPLLLLDAAVVVPAFLIPLSIRFDGAIPSEYWSSFWRFLPVIVTMEILANYLFGLYGQMWRYASVQEARRVLLAGATGLVLVFCASALVSNVQRPLPISVLLFGSAAAVMAFGAIRFQSRLFGFRRRSVPDERRHVLLVGAGDAGAMVLNDILRNPALGLDVVGIVDDDPRLQGRSLHGVSVLGDRRDLEGIIAGRQVDQVLLAIPTATSELIRDVAERCERAGASLRVLPSVHEIVGGRVTVSDMRDLQIEDLLGRQQVATELGAVEALLHGKRVLITGAGGSIGSEISRQVAAFGPAELALLDNDETHLHDLVATLGDLPSCCVLADVRDAARLREVMRSYRPQVVFHAAAHKHVPILEQYPQEAFLTNVLGTANVAEAAIASGAERFVLISTDKAVRPSSVMGGSKRMAEEVVRSLGGRGTALCAVRFGNVLGSRGSVIPTFLKQIADGGPVTVTDPTMTRYFMSVQEAVQLVLQASAMAEGGEVFTLEMGEPVNILDLANRLIRLSGQVPGRDIQIEVIGPRPGEKQHEELVQDDEEPVLSGHPGIVVASPPPPNPAVLRRRIREMAALTEAGNLPALAEALRRPDEPPDITLAPTGSTG